jgi:2-haloacid dehalogenase
MTVGAPAVDTLLFDTMGTVVDIDGSIQDRLTAILAHHGWSDVDRIGRLWDRNIRTAMDEINDGYAEWKSHRTLRRNALEFLIKTDELPGLTAAERDDLVNVVGTLRAWSDSVRTLAALGSRMRIVALSNADLAELSMLSKNAGLGWHAVISAQLVHAYKPHESVYQSALDLLQLDAEHTMMVAAHRWDLRAAARLGMRTAYIARPGAEAPSRDDHFTVEATDLAALAARLLPSPSLTSPLQRQA